jgi:hypothetical protein
MNIVDPPGSGLGGPNLAGVEFVLLGIVYIVGSVLIWLFGVVTERNSNNDIFGVDLKKFKKCFLVFNALLLVAGGSWYLTLFVPYWTSSIDYRTLRLKLIALGLRDTFEMVVVIAPAVLTFFSLLHYKSRETIYKVWFGYTLLGLLAFAFLNMVMGDYLYSDEKLYFWNLGGIYVIGSTLVWLYGVAAHFFGLRTEVEIKLEKIKKKLPVLSAKFLAFGVSLYLILLVAYRLSLTDFTMLGDTGRAIISILKGDIFLVMLIIFILPALLVLFSLMYQKSRDITYKTWLWITSITFVIFAGMLLSFIVEFHPDAEKWSYHSPKFIRFGIFYFVVSIIIWFSDVTTTPKNES